MSNLTDIQKDILVNMMEEAAEVIQACSKMLRFGNNKKAHAKGKGTNKTYLSLEIGNLDRCITLAEEQGLVNESVVGSGYRSKLKKWR
jgi:hypothetical protein